MMEFVDIRRLEHQKETAVWLNHFYYNRGCRKKKRNNETARKVNWIVHKNAWTITVEITINLAASNDFARSPFFIVPNSMAQTIISEIPCLCTFGMWLKTAKNIDRRLFFMELNDHKENSWAAGDDCGRHRLCQTYNNEPRHIGFNGLNFNSFIPLIRRE